MANGHGGDRTPRNAAPVSGPGALSQRTDGQAQRIAAGGGYGDRKDMQQIQSGAPMTQAGGATTPAPSGPPPTPLKSPTARPEEPITAGAPVGAGIGPEAAGIANDEQATMSQLAPLVESLTAAANLPSSTPQFRAFVRRLRVQVGQQQTPM